MCRSARIVVFSVLLIGCFQAFAKTPDGQPPSVETVCDNETGAAYGLCTAYCEAKDCGDPNQHASDTACEANRRNFEKKTGRPIPCEITCPCSGLVELFGRITTGAVVVDQCIDYGFLLFVSTQGGAFVTVENGPPAACSANDQPPPVILTDIERLVCRVALRKAVEAQGVMCRPPE